jgi:chromosome segregation ATPase
MAELPSVETENLADINDRLETLRQRERSLDTTINNLQGIIQFNEGILDGDQPQILDHLEADDGGDVTEQLLEDETLSCWTCGSEVEREAVETTLNRLRSLRAEQFDEIDVIREEIDDLEAQKRDIEESKEERESVTERLDRVETEIADREATLEELEAEHDDLEGRVETLEETVDDLEAENDDERFELQREVNRLEFQLRQQEKKLDDIESEIEEIDERLDEREALEARREEVQAELEELRTRIERTETDAIEAFNEHMEEVLDVLEYSNIERIWLERTERQVTQGRKRVDKTVFDLHIVRSTADGATYEDSIDHLSESEREVTGLVFALAGYRVHDVHEQLPFMLLDSLEALDSDRIAALIEYFEPHVDHLVAALLPEDAAALDEDYQRVTDI